MVLVVVAVLVVAAASADPLADQLAQGNALMEALDFEEAAAVFTSVAVDERASEEQKIEANLLAGTAHRILGRDNEARLCFRYVLLKRPETRMNPSKSPKVVQFFELVRQELLAEASVRTSTAPADAATPTTSNGGASVTPVVVLAGGAAALVIGGAAATFVESSLAQPQTAAAQDQLLLAGRTSVVVAAVGVLALTSGAIMWGLQ